MSKDLWRRAGRPLFYLFAYLFMHAVLGTKPRALLGTVPPPLLKF